MSKAQQSVTQYSSYHFSTNQHLQKLADTTPLKQVYGRKANYTRTKFGFQILQQLSAERKNDECHYYEKGKTM